MKTGIKMGIRLALGLVTYLLAYFPTNLSPGVNMSRDSNHLHKRYIVRLKDGVDFEAHFASLRECQTPLAFTVIDTFDPAFLNAYVAKIRETDISALKNHEDVLHIEEDAEDTVD